MRRPPDRNFFLAIALVFLFFSSLVVGLIIWTNDHRDVQQIASITYHEWGYAQMAINTTAEHYQLFRILLAAIFSVSGLFLLISFLKKGELAGELAATTKELASACAGTMLSFRSMSLQQRSLAIGLFLVIIGIRIYYAILYPPYVDEVASYDLFVSKGWLAIIGYYPLANDHILFNLIARFFYSMNDDLLWTMRLPNLLIGMASTILIFLLLFRISDLFIATVSTSLFSLSQMGIFLQFIGRGYALFIICSALCMLAIIKLASGSRNERGLWSVFAISSTAGLYTIPAFLYPFLSSLLIGIVLFWRSGKRVHAFRLAQLSVMVGAVAALLYSPVLLISGTTALFGNRYVTPLTTADMVAEAPAYFLRMEHALLGSHTAGPWILAATLFGFIALVLTRKISAPLLWLGWMCIAYIVLPYIYMTVQHVLPPDRVIYFKQLFFVILLAIVVRTFLDWLSISDAKRALLFLLPLVYGAKQVHQLHQEIAPLEQLQRQISTMNERIVQSDHSQVLVMQPFYELFLLHHQQKRSGHPQLFSSAARVETPGMIIVGKDHHHDLKAIDHSRYEITGEDDHVLIFERRSNP